MQEYIFKKDGHDNNKIIVSLIHFLLRNFENKKQLVMEHQDGSIHLITNKMLAQSHLSYMLIDIYSGMNDDMPVNTILQFYLNHHLHPTADDSIWIADNTEVHIEEIEGIEKSFTFIEKSSFYETPIKRRLLER